MKKAILVDIDGTLSVLNGRNPFKYNEAGSDTLNKPIADLVNLYKNAGYSVILLTGREDYSRRVTEDWLLRHGIDYEVLFMRPSGDYCKSTTLKRRIYEENIAPHYEVELVLEDFDKNIIMFNELGLPTLKVTWTS